MKPGVVVIWNSYISIWTSTKSRAWDIGAVNMVIDHSVCMNGFIKTHLILCIWFCSVNTGSLLYMIPLGLAYSIRCQTFLFPHVYNSQAQPVNFFSQVQVGNQFLLWCSTVVANELGSGKPQPAKLAARVVMCLAFTEGLVIALAMVFLRHVWGYMYSDKQQVVSYIARMLPILSISFFMDGLHGSLSGIFFNIAWVNP
jgi:hypothetical protein